MEIHGRFCKKLTGMPNCAAGGYVEMELGSDSKVLISDCVFEYRIPGKTVV
jgi:hypothetical protein